MASMIRIEPPQWAYKPTLDIGGVTIADYAAIQQYRNDLLAIVHGQVENYINDPQLTYDGDEEGFPHRQWLSGAYYIGGESYFLHRNPAWLEISVMCKCLRRPRTGEDRESDYLGLTVWLKCMPGQWAMFEVAGNTDSSAL